MKRNLFFALLCFALFALQACGDSADKGKEGEGDPKTEVKDKDTDNSPKSETSWEKGGLKVSAMEDSPKFPDAKLELKTPPRGVDLAAGENQFEFNVEGYELGAQTADAANKGLANSGKGQHIHFILNNGPYSAYYEPTFKHSLEDGHYVMLAFLSRSYHESVKAPGAFAVTQFAVGQPENFKEADLGAPHMMYSRPKGTYKGDDTKKLMLDFYLLNCDLSPDGYKVRATINDNEFMFTKWVPYVIEGLPLGEVNIKLELLDKDGNLVESPFNPSTRTVTLAEADPS
ncbi:MAG: phosphopeptide-binding protein [Bacteroidota bacterium]